MPCESGHYDIVEPALYLDPPIHHDETRQCPHCSEFRNITGFLGELWEANLNDEFRYFMFHEPYQFLSDYWHMEDIKAFRGMVEWKRKLMLKNVQPGQLHRVWGDGMGGWSKEFLELFPDGIDSIETTEPGQPLKE